MPDRAPDAGEQYRFHFDMGKCIGCKCCVVACNEQNGNPASINWRRVSEIEGGWFPNATRSFLSMGCNHCAEPTCLAGCPVDAYTKDPLHAPPNCVPQLRLCQAAPADRIRIVGFLSSQQLSVFSPEVRARNDLPATR